MNEQKIYSNLKYNLSFKKNFYKKDEANNKKLLYENNNLYSDFSYKNQHRTNSNDFIKRKKYITNIKGYNTKKEKQRIQNHSNVDINVFNKELSTSSIYSNNSQVKSNSKLNNYNFKRRDYSSNSNINLNNNAYNEIIQLRTEISERTKSSYINNKNDIKQINNNINNIYYSKKNYPYNNSSNRNNIHYTKNNNYSKNIASKKLNYQLKYESHQQK